MWSLKSPWKMVAIFCMNPVKGPGSPQPWYSELSLLTWIPKGNKQTKTVRVSEDVGQNTAVLLKGCGNLFRGSALLPIINIFAPKCNSHLLMRDCDGNFCSSLQYNWTDSYKHAIKAAFFFSSSTLSYENLKHQNTQTGTVVRSFCSVSWRPYTW